MGHNMAPYPGHADLPYPRTEPRVRVEGEPNYIKNMGTVKVKVFDDTAPIIKTPKPEPRCPSSDSKRNYKVGWFGTVPPLLKGTASPRPSTAPPRVKPEAETIAHVSRGPRMKVIVNEYARKGPSPRVPRVKPEADGIAEFSKGARMFKVLNKYGTRPPPPCPVPRLKLDGELNCQNSRGKQMSDTLHKYGQNERSPKPHPRVRPEAEDNADLDRGRQMRTIFHKYGRGPLSARAVPRVKPEGEPNATLDTGFRMCRLIQDVKSVPATPRPKTRVSGSQGRWNAIKGRGSMEEIFKSMALKTFVYVPGEQTRHYGRASIA